MMIIIVSNSNIDFKNVTLLMYMYVIDNKLYSILSHSTTLPYNHNIWHGT